MSGCMLRRAQEAHQLQIIPDFLLQHTERVMVSQQLHLHHVAQE